MSTPSGSIERDFGSDNRGGLCEVALSSWLDAARCARADSYGNDPWTAAASEGIAALFHGVDVESVLWVPTGTAGNQVVVGSCSVGPGAAVVCADDAHIRLDEAGAIERAWGTPLVCVDAPTGRIEAEVLTEVLTRLVDNLPFSLDPSVVMVTLPSEAGRMYTIDQIAELVDVSRRYGARVCLDGARFANALARDAALAEVFNAGVSALVVGGTKNGLPGAEAVVCADRRVADVARRAAKQLGQVMSKSRFLTAPAAGCLRQGCYLQHARAANDAADRLAGALTQLGVALHWPTEANLVFADVGDAALAEIQQATGALTWRPGVLRFACGFDHVAEDVDRVVDVVRAALSTGGEEHRSIR